MSPGALMRRLLPRGPVDALWQALVITAAYMLWRHARGAAAGGAAESLDHARDLVAAERWLHSFVELDVQAWAIDSGWLIDLTSWMYGHAHFTGSLAALIFIYVVHNRSYCFVRNMVIASMCISVLGYLFYPTAPPRFVPELGFSAAHEVTGNDPVLVSDDPLFNPYAAVPSMHITFSLIFGLALAQLTRPRALKAAFALYPLLMTFIVVATGNHFWLDAAAGVLVAALALATALGLAALRPERWSFRGEGSEAPRAEPEPEPEAAVA